MGYYAAFLDLGGRPCLLVGGGRPAEEKARGLLEAGARLTVVWDNATAGLKELAATDRLALLRRRFQPADLDGCFLAVDASEDRPTGDAVAAAARERGVLLNVLDRPELCDFIAPALVRRGPLQVAISTAGRSPFMAAHVRRMLESTVTPELGRLVELTGELRDRLRAEGVPLAAQTAIYERIPASGALTALRAGDVEAARAAVQACAETPADSGAPRPDLERLRD